MTQGAKGTLLFPAFLRKTGKYTYSLLLIDGLSCPTGVFYTTTGYPTKYCVLEILSNILLHIEYSSDYTGSSAGYPIFSIAYVVYSTSQTHDHMITSREKRAWRKRPRNAGYYNNIRDGHVLLVNSMQTADIFHFLTESIVHTRIACMAILCIRPAKLPTPLIIDRLVQWVGFVASRWRRRGAAYEASRRSDITYFIIHRKVNNSDGPSWPERSSRNELTHETRHWTHTIHWPQRVSNHPKSISWEHQLS